MSNAPAYLPLFGSDYLADTRHLTTEEHGAYLLLLIAAWRQDDCGLPLDDKKLARIAGLSTRKWAQMKGTILEFWKVESGRIYQARLHKEWAYARKKSEGNRENARKRWEAQVPENIDGDQCDRISDGNAPQPQPQPQVDREANASPSTPRARKPKQARTRKTPLKPTVVIPDWMPSMQWDAFLHMRKEKGAVPTPRAIELLIGKLERLRSQGNDPGAVLDQSTLKTWIDVYALKDDNHASRDQSLQTGSRYGSDRRSSLGRAIDEGISSLGN